MPHRTQYLATVLLLLVLPSIALATGKIKGRVVDTQSKEALIGANIVLVGTTYGAASGINGEFSILNVPEGTYSVRASYIGYSATTLQDVRVDFNLTTEVALELTPTQISVQPVIVVAERPLVNKNSTNAVRIITSSEIAAFPVKGIDNILALQPGVVQQDGAFHIRGGRADEVGYQLDGVSIADPVSGTRRLNLHHDAIEEISVQSSGYEAEYGRANSGIVQYVMKSGGPAFKGTLEYVTDNIGFQSARSFGNGQKLLGAYWHGYDQLTGTAGGPILDKRFKYFGLVDYSFRRDNSPQAYTGVDVGGVKDPVSLDSVYLKYPAGVMLKNSNEVYAGTGSISADLLPLKIRLSGNISKGNSYSGSVFRMFDTERSPEVNNSQGFGSLKMTYVFGPSVFAEASAGFFRYFVKTYDPVLKDDFLSYGDSVANAQAGYVWERRPGIPTGRYITSRSYQLYDWFFPVWGTPVSSYSKNQRDNYTFTAALTAQLGRNHTFKLGGDYLRYTIRTYNVSSPANLAMAVAQNDTASTAKKKTLDQIVSPSVSAWGYDALGNELNTSDYLGARHPVFASAYVQDKMEFGDLVVNVGLRYDYIDADSYQLLDPSRPDLAVDPNTLAILPAGLQHSRPLSLATPRLGAAFALTDRVVFHAQFAKLIQQSRLLDDYATWRSFASAAAKGGLLPTNLGPLRTTQYEAGISEQVGEFASLDVTAFYKDVYDQTKQQIVTTAVTSAFGTYYNYVNGDYATTKGLEFSFQMRRTRRFMASASLTLQDGQGSGSYPNPSQASFGIYQQMIVPLEYNNKVRGSVFLDYRFGLDDGGAMMSGVAANVVMTFNSGHPYTMLRNDATVGKPLEALNSSTTPSSFQVDLRIEKNFSLADKLLSTVYVSVINLFDARNVYNVWPWTGSATDDGWLVEPTTGEKLAQSRGQQYVDMYRQLSLNYGQPGVDVYTSTRYGPPRQIRLGLRLEYN